MNFKTFAVLSSFVLFFWYLGDHDMRLAVGALLMQMFVIREDISELKAIINAGEKP